MNLDSNYDFRKCLGLKVKPRRGDGLLFYSLFSNGTIDPVTPVVLLSPVSAPLFIIVFLVNVYCILMYLLYPQTSLHGSCAVIKGEKWVATKWIRDNVQFD